MDAAHARGKIVFLIFLVIKQLSKNSSDVHGKIRRVATRIFKVARHLLDVCRIGRVGSTQFEANSTERTGNFRSVSANNVAI